VSLSTRDTVETETPTLLATSLIVTTRRRIYTLRRSAVEAIARSGTVSTSLFSL